MGPSIAAWLVRLRRTAPYLLRCLPMSLIHKPDQTFVAPMKRRLSALALGVAVTAVSWPAVAQFQLQQPQQIQNQSQNQSQNSTPNRDTERADPLEQAPGGPVRLRQPAPADTRDPRDDRAPMVVPGTSTPLMLYRAGEFERFVQRQSPTVEIRRFGSELVTAANDARNADLSPLVPPDYVVAPGDEVLLTLWGSVDADLRLTVDRSGRISLPRVGSVQVSGVRNADLQAVIERRVAQVFRNFQLSVSLGQLRGVRVFVTGFVVKSGTYTVSSLSTVVGVLMRAGGPSAAGSFRDVQLRRGAQVVGTFDLYDLLVNGDRSADGVVQAGDVVHVGPVGKQVGVIGSVNRPAVIELKPGETVADALKVAGGLTAVADRSRLGVERLADRGGARIVQLELPRDQALPLGEGDVLRAFSAVDAALPTQRQSKRVRVEGEVLRPAEYVLPEGSSMADALRAAGGLTPAAFLYATEFSRESVRITQQENYDRALRDLETDFARSSSSQRVSSSEEAAGQSARASATSRLIERLRALRPTGRVVLQMQPDTAALPELALEDGDRILVPPRPTTVGVFGSVFNAASYLYIPQRNVEEYLRLAGGPTKGADESSIFVVRANGDVMSSRQRDRGWFRRGDINGIRAEPGDTVFVPEEMDKTTFLQSTKDWTQILYQFGLGIAGIASAVR
jgi:protein involved in polysaccharide export with SLBB domain